MICARMAVYGRLGGDPERIEAAKSEMAVASLAVDVDREPGGAPLWLKVLAFGKLAGLLERHSKGDPLSVSGRLERNRYTGRDGVEKSQWQLVADSIVGAKSTRPGGGRKKDKGRSAATPDPALADAATFDDKIPF